MGKFDPTLTTLAGAALLAVVASVGLNQMSSGSPEIAATATVVPAQAAETTTAARPQWAASATGRIEPKTGEIRLSAEVPGKIADIIVDANDRVDAGDPLMMLETTDLASKLAAAEAEALVRVRERDEEPVKGPALERRQAEDTLAASERAHFRALRAFDEGFRQAKSGQSTADAVKGLRDKLASAKEKVETDRAALLRISDKPDMPLPTRLESALTQARSDVRQVETAFERTRLRAPAAGTVLAVFAKEGEMAAPSAEAPVLLFGDISALRVRAEVEERDAPKLRIGQRVVIRADAFPDRDFDGVVTQVGQALGAPRITTRGPRRPNDIEVLEVLASLEGTPPLLTGMRVDVFFRHDEAASTAPAAQ